MSNTLILCESCRFWDADQELSKRSYDGKCRKRAPIPITIGEEDPIACWPQTTAEDWCGEAEHVHGLEDAARRLYEHEPHMNAGKPIPWDDLTEAWKKFFGDKAAATLGISRKG